MQLALPRAAVQDEMDLTLIPVLPPSGTVGRNGVGPFVYDIDELVAAIRAVGSDVPVFLNHNTNGDAVGWIDHRATPVPNAEGGWDWPVQMTEAGAEKLRTKAYRYTSPTLLCSRAVPAGASVGPVIGLFEVSLVNLPNLPLRSMNSADGDSYTVHIPNKSGDKVNPEVLKALGLDPAAEHSDEAILAAIDALAVAAASLNSITAAAGAPAGATAEGVIEAVANSRVAAGVLVSKQEFDVVSNARDLAVNELAAFKAEAHENAAVAAVDAAIAAGKFVPATRDVLLKQARIDIENFNALAAATPVHPALSAASNSVAIQDTKTQGAALPEATKEMLKALRIDTKFVS